MPTTTDPAPLLAVPVLDPDPDHEALLLLSGTWRPCGACVELDVDGRSACVPLLDLEAALAEVRAGMLA